MSNYRWNAAEAARAYDGAAAFIHPYYLEIHEQIVEVLSQQCYDAPLVVDLGGGTGQLIERILTRLPSAEGVIIDKSEPALTVASERLNRFGKRAGFAQLSLQGNWTAALSRAPSAIVSTSAIHHLEPTEKRSLFARCQECLAPGGVFLNGDEIRPDSDADYLRELRTWDVHMQCGLTTGKIPDTFAGMVAKWKDRNIDHFGEPRHSGDDCHETVETLIGHLIAAGFASAEVKWRKAMWAVFAAER